MGASFTAANVEMVPFVEEEVAILRAELETMTSYRYFIVGRTFTGARFISEYIDWEDTAEMFRNYESMVSYFGHGTVTLYEETLGDVVPIRMTYVY